MPHKTGQMSEWYRKQEFVIDLHGLEISHGWEDLYDLEESDTWDEFDNPDNYLEDDFPDI